MEQKYPRAVALQVEKAEDWQDTAALTGVIICLVRPVKGKPAGHGKAKVG